MDYKYAYIVGIVPILIIWIIMFLLRKDLRKEMLVLSVMVAIGGTTAVLHYGEYWTPVHIYKFPGINLGFEDLLLSFLYGGIVSAIYEFLFKKHLGETGKDPIKVRILESILAFFASSFIFFILEFLTDLNIIYTTSIAFIVWGIILLYFRKDLIKVSIYTALLSGLVFILIIWNLVNNIYPGLVEAWWNIEALSGIYVVGVPIEELIFHSALGFAFAPIYEVYFGLRNG